MDTQFLLKQYVDTGLPIPEKQFNKLSDNLKKTYIRKREIAINNHDFPDEFEYMDDEFSESLDKVIPYTYEIKYLSDEVLMKLVKFDPRHIIGISNPSEEIQLIAIQRNPYLIRYIKKPTEKVKKIVNKLEVLKDIERIKELTKNS